MSSPVLPSPAPSSLPVIPPKAPHGEGHDHRGRFTAGNRCGKGNPAAKQTASLRQALRAAVSPEDITDTADILLEMALDGNLSAIRLLLSYVVGRPGAEDRDDADPAPAPPDTPALPPAPAPVVVPPPDASAPPPAPAASPREEAPSVYSAAPGPESPAPQALRPPSETAIFSARFFIPAGGVCVGVYRRGMPQPLWASLIDCGGRFRARGKRPPLFPLAQPKSTSIVLLSLEFPRHHSLDSGPRGYPFLEGGPSFLPTGLLCGYKLDFRFL